MKILRIVVGILSLVAILAIGLQACSAANAAIDGTTPSTLGAAAFTAGLFLSVGYLFAGVTALAARKHNGGGVAAGCFFVLANLFVGGGGSDAAGFTLWTGLGWLFAALLIFGGLIAMARRRRDRRIGIPPIPGRSI
jgi:hypothetical protein